MGVKSGVLVKNENIEKVHFQFLKRIVGVRVTTPNCLVYGELGRYPLDINILEKRIKMTTRGITNL
jgi:hypothetical protein